LCFFRTDIPGSQHRVYRLSPSALLGNQFSIRFSTKHPPRKLPVTGMHEMATQAMSRAFGFAATFCIGTRSIRWEVPSIRNIGSQRKTWRNSTSTLLARLKWWPNFTRDIARLFTLNDQLCVPSHGGSTVTDEIKPSRFCTDTSSSHHRSSNAGTTRFCRGAVHRSNFFRPRHSSGQLPP